MLKEIHDGGGGFVMHFPGEKRAAQPEVVILRTTEDKD